jgi:hypothetical protein
MPVFWRDHRDVLYEASTAASILSSHAQLSMRRVTRQGKILPARRNAVASPAESAGDHYGRMQSLPFWRGAGKHVCGCFEDFLVGKKEAIE